MPDMKLKHFFVKMMLFTLITSFFLLTNTSYAQQVAKSAQGTPLTNCGGYYAYVPASYAAGTGNFRFKHQWLPGSSLTYFLSDNTL